jgi:hypothetical protein
MAASLYLRCLEHGMGSICYCNNLSIDFAGIAYSREDLIESLFPQSATVIGQQGSPSSIVVSIEYAPSLVCSKVGDRRHFGAFQSEPNISRETNIATQAINKKYPHGTFQDPCIASSLMPLPRST